MERAYTVTGHWPFPLDMLRRDSARAVTPEDQIKIDRLSKDHPEDGYGLHEKVSIHLTMQSGEASKWQPMGRLLPNEQRWNSFQWEVSGVPEFGEERAARTAGPKPVSTADLGSGWSAERWADGSMVIRNAASGLHIPLPTESVNLLRDILANH